MSVHSSMALLCYLKPVNGLPNPRRSLSSSISPQMIAEVNKEVQKVVGTMHGHRKTGEIVQAKWPMTVPSLITDTT